MWWLICGNMLASLPCMAAAVGANGWPGMKAPAYEPVPDRLPEVPGKPSIEHPEVWSGGDLADLHQRSKHWSYRPKPEPLEGPASLSYERIVRLEWECEIRGGAVTDWHRDVGQAQALDLEYRRELVRRHERSAG